MMDDRQHVAPGFVTSGHAALSPPEFPEAPQSYALCHSPQMRALASSLARVAATEVPVLIEGETGSGKTTLAKQVYEGSRRRAVSLLVFHGATLTREAIDTLAQRSEHAVLIEEVGELAPGAQDALVRLLADQSQQGGLRLITTTSDNLAELATRRRLRVDLLYRIDVVRLMIPPLRHRPDDMLGLAEHFLSVAAQHFCREVRDLSADARARLLQHDWPGNVRELRNCVVESVLQCSRVRLEAADLHLRAPSAGSDPEAEFTAALLRLHAAHPSAFHSHTQRLILQWSLHLCGGNRVRAAALLGLGRGALRAKLRRCGLDARSFAD